MKIRCTGVVDREQLRSVQDEKELSLETTEPLDLDSSRL